MNQTRRDMLKLAGLALTACAVPGQALAAPAPQKVSIEDFARGVDAVDGLAKNWSAVTARGKSGEVNAMTAGWGGLGNAWKKPVCTVYIGPHYTRKLIDETGRFTVAYFDGACKQELTYLGTHTGAEEKNKIAKAGLHLVDLDGRPAIAEGRWACVCRVLLRHELSAADFVDASIPRDIYGSLGWSVMYCAEIESAWKLS
ncbi:MAG: hypothetical protein IK061_01790 [Desulfovibrio sp.]|nr:hypothetical protein [Desulfovibrio sp.]